MANKKVKHIENSGLPIKVQSELLLIYANQKPATVWDVPITLPCWPTWEHQPYPRYINRVKRTLRRLNLPHFLGEPQADPNEPITSAGKRMSVYVGQNEQWLERIIDAGKVGDSREYGRCFGFPGTAIEAFLGERPVFYGFFHDDDCAEFFTHWVQSEEFFKEEIDSTSRRWHATIKKFSPKLLAKILEAYPAPKKNDNNVCWRYMDNGRTVFCYE